MKQLYIFIIIWILLQPEYSLRPKFRQSYIQSQVNSKIKEPVENKIERLKREALSMPPPPPNPNATKYPQIQDGTSQQYNIKKSIQVNPDAELVYWCYIFRSKDDIDYMERPERVQIDIVDSKYNIKYISGQILASILWDDIIYQIGKIEQPLPDFLKTMASNDRESQYYFPYYDQAKKLIKQYDLNQSHFFVTSEEVESSSSDDDEDKKFRFQEQNPMEEIKKNAEYTKSQNDILLKNIEKAQQVESSSSDEDELQNFAPKNKRRLQYSEFGIPLNAKKWKIKRDYLKENRQYVLLFNSDFGVDQFLSDAMLQSYFKNRMKNINNIKMPTLPPVIQQYCKSYNTDHKYFEEGIMLIDKEKMNIQRTSDRALLNGFWWNLIIGCSFTHIKTLEDVELAEGHSVANINPKSCATFVVQWSPQIQRRQYLCFDKLELKGQAFWVEVLGAHLKKTCMQAVGIPENQLAIEEQLIKLQQKSEEKLKNDKYELRKLEDKSQSQMSNSMSSSYSYTITNQNKNNALSELQSMQNEVDDDKILKNGKNNGSNIQEINILKYKIANDQHDQITLQEALEQPELIDDFVWRRLFEQRKDDDLNSSDLLRKVLKLLYNLDKKYREKQNFDKMDLGSLDFIVKSIPDPSVYLTKWEEHLLQLIQNYANQQNIQGITLLTENEKTLIKTQNEYNNLGYKFDAENTNRLLNLNVAVQQDISSLTQPEHEQLRILNGLLMKAGQLADDEKKRLEWENEELRKLERRMNDNYSDNDSDNDSSDDDYYRKKSGLGSSDDDSSDFDGKKKFGGDIGSSSDDDDSDDKKKQKEDKKCDPIIFEFDELGFAINTLQPPGYLIKQNDDVNKTLSITSEFDRQKVVNVPNAKMQEMICRGFEYFDSEWERLLGERNFGPRTDGKDDSSSSSSDEDNDKKKKNVKDDEEDESDDLESKLRQDLENNLAKLQFNMNNTSNDDNNNSNLDLKDAVDSDQPVKAADQLADQQNKNDNDDDNNNNSKDNSDKNEQNKNEQDDKDKSDDKNKKDDKDNNDKNKNDKNGESSKSDSDKSQKKNSRDMEKDVMKDAAKKEQDAKNQRSDSKNSPNQNSKNQDSSMGSDKNSKNDKSGGDSDNNKDKSNSPPKTGIPNGDPGDLIAKVPKDQPLSDYPEISKSLQPNESLVTGGLKEPQKDGVAGTGPKAPNPELERALKSINDTNDADM